MTPGIPVWPLGDGDTKRGETTRRDADRPGFTDRGDPDANIRVATQSAFDLRAKAREMGLDWDDLDHDQRAEVAFAAPNITQEDVSNTVCIGLAEYLVTALVSGDSPKISELRIGAGTGTSYQDRELTDGRGSTSVSKRRNDGDSAFAAVFIDTTQFNGITISEAGLDADGKLLNHADGFQAIPKDSGRSVTFEGTLSLGPSP